MDPRWTGSYDVVVVYQTFLLFLIALLGSLTCLGALAYLLLAWQESLGSSRPSGAGFRSILARATPNRSPSETDLATWTRLARGSSPLKECDAPVRGVYSFEAELP